jgi:hypothetical protein
MGNRLCLFLFLSLINGRNLLPIVRNPILTLTVGRSEWRPVEAIVPLYAPGQNSRDEKYIQTSIGH